MNVAEFVGRYEARFGPFPADMNNPWQSAEWAPVIDAIPAERCGQLLDIVGKSTGRFLPRISKFKDALAALDVQSIGPHMGDCLYCYGGTLLILCRKVDNKVFLTDAGASLHLRGVPCACERGKRIGQNMRALECREWVTNKANEWGLVDTFDTDFIPFWTRWAWACDKRIRDNARLAQPAEDDSIPF